jgi:hypothetical protein
MTTIDHLNPPTVQKIGVRLFCKDRCRFATG